MCVPITSQTGTDVNQLLMLNDIISFAITTISKIKTNALMMVMIKYGMLQVIETGDEAFLR